MQEIDSPRSNRSCVAKASAVCVLPLVFIHRLRVFSFVNFVSSR